MPETTSPVPTPMSPARPPKRVLTLEVATGFKCESCEKVYTDPAECPPLRECSNENCGDIFESDDRACPQCNRTFTRRNADHGCPECNEEAVEVDYVLCPSCNEPLVCDGCDTAVGGNL